MKKQMLFLGILLSLSGLATAKNHEMTKESLSDSTNKNQLFYKIDVIDSGQVRNSLSGAFIGSNYVESLKRVSYIKEITKDNENLVATPGFVEDGVKLEITPSSINLHFQELVSLNNVYLDSSKKEFIQTPVTKRLSYDVGNLNLAELKGCLVVNELKEKSLNILSGDKAVKDSYINFKVCDSEQALNQ